MLLNKIQKEKFKELYPVTPIPILCEMYGVSNKSILGMARNMGIYESKLGKDKIKKHATISNG